MNRISISWAMAGVKLGRKLNRMPVFKSHNPLIESCLIPYREKASNGMQCYQSIKNASRILAIEIANRLPYCDYSLETITRSGIKTLALCEGILLVVKIRSGIAMLDSFSDVLNTSNTAFVSINRDSYNIDYSTVSKSCHKNEVIILDPLIATGRTINLMIDHLLSYGINISRIQVASLICSGKGIKEIEATYPSVKLNIGLITEALDTNAGVYPHIGDIGDRMFRT